MNGISAGHVVNARGQRDGLVHDIGVDALAGEQLGGQAAGIGEQGEKQMVGLNLGIAGVVGLVLRLDNDVAGAWGEPPESRIRVERCVNLRHEPFLRGLLGDAHALADLGPRRPRLAGLVDEMPDEVVGDLAEGLGGEHGVGELLQRFGVHLLDDIDEVVEADGVGDLRRLGHAVNLRLTRMIRQPLVDAWHMHI